LSQVKQLVYALQNHHDTRKTLPLASTAPYLAANQIQKFGELGVRDTPKAGAQPRWEAGQDGDGYSWIVQILPFIEENVIYDKLVQQVGTDRMGRLRDAAFAKGTMAPTQNPGKAPHNVKLGAGNYVALPSTHYTTTPSNHLESGLPTANNSKNGKSCAQGAYCGNGGLPFPGTVGGAVQKIGLGFQSLSDGTSKVALITESREEVITSWYSGLASYVVGAWPQGEQPIGQQVTPPSPGAPVFWGCATTGNTTCDHALNKGDTKNMKALYYQGSTKATPHAPPNDRIWGPSSRHPGVIIHGFADAHAEPVSETIGANQYFAMVTRNGREVDTSQ
jgi:hypothetical protein